MAMPHWVYGDPAHIIEVEQLRQMGCSACSRAVIIGGAAMCPGGLSFPRCKRDQRNGYRLAESHGGSRHGSASLR